MKCVVAFLLHAPGLRLFYGQRLGPRTFRANVLALATTVAASLLSWGLSGRAAVGITVWAAGHVVWGLVLVARARDGRLGQ